MVERTWARDCDKYFFIVKVDDTIEGHEVSKPFPILQPTNLLKEAYEELTDKIYKTYMDVYSKYNDYDWYLKADDDTFVFIDNLRKFLKTRNLKYPATYGYNFKGQFLTDDEWLYYNSGGAGYALSNMAMKRITDELKQNYSYCPMTGVEDLDVGNCLRMLSISPQNTMDSKKLEMFHPLTLRDHVYGEYPDWLEKYSVNTVKRVSL